MSEEELKAHRKEVRTNRKKYIKSLEASNAEVAQQIKRDMPIRAKHLRESTALFDQFKDLAIFKDMDMAVMRSPPGSPVKASAGAAAAAAEAKSPGAGRRHRKTEKEEDAELLDQGDHADESEHTQFVESPGYINGTMRDYQIRGLNWMVGL